MAKKQTVDSKQSVIKATISAKDLRNKSVVELNEALKTTKADLTEAQRMHVAGELVNPNVIGMFRKTIARIQTLLVEKSREKTERKED